MPVASFPDRDSPAFRRTLLAMVFMGYLPLLLVSASVLVGIATWRLAGAWGIGGGIAFLYLFPPLLSRVWALRRGDLEGSRLLDEGGLLRWWFGLQCQTVFNRIRFLEEVLRLFPAAYSGWLRLWGSSIGSLVTWSPGVLIADRQLLEVGDGVIFGAGARVFSHFVSRDDRGEMYLQVAGVRVGDECVVGAFATLGPSIDVPDGAAVRGSRLVLEHLADPRPWEHLARREEAEENATAPRSRTP